MGQRLHPIAYVALFGSAILIAIGVGWYAVRQASDQPGPGANGTGYGAPPNDKVEIHLYFGDQQGRYLTAEQRVIDRCADAADFGRRIVSELLKGPRQGASPTLPRGTQLRALYVVEDGIAFVDFEAGSFDRHPGGVHSELLSVYSIVNTMVLNMEAIKSVKILIGGQEAATLAGHVDLSYPFKADMLWVR